MGTIEGTTSAKLRTAFSTRIKKTYFPHFMGAIVLQSKGNEKTVGEVKRALVADSQQNLTTLQLLLKATQNAFKTSLSDARKFEDLDKLLFNDQKRTGNDYLNKTKIHQSNTLDQSDFQEVIRDMVDAYRSRSVTKSHKYFHEMVY